MPDHNPATGQVRRRWTSEAQVLDELEQLNDTSMALVQDYRVQAVEAAQAEATHKSLRARRALIARTNGVKSITEAELTAEADTDVAEAYMARLTTAAVADATREALRSVRTNQDSLRTAAASHRDQVAGPGMGGGRR